MSKLRLCLAMGSYDYLEPLKSGRVKPEGIDLTLLDVPCGIRHGRMLEHGSYDASEFSLGSYLVGRARGVESLQAIPFVPRRLFSQRCVFVRADSEAQRVADLKGGRVGILSYQNSLAIAFKGLWMQSGLGLSDVTWVSEVKERLPLQLPSSVRLEHAVTNLQTLLLRGEIDALVAPDLPSEWLNGDGRLRRLFADYQTAERADFARTRVFPIMHVTVIRGELLEREPWVAGSLFDALEASRVAHRRWAEETHRLSIVWPQGETEHAFFRRDPFGQGFPAIRQDLEGMLRLADEQGLLSAPLRAEDLFRAEDLSR